MLLFATPAAAQPTHVQRVHGQTFTLPADCVVSLAAGDPLVARPVNADFDDLGRLYVTEASGTNDPVQKQLKDKPHRVVRLEDTDGDGVFDKRVVFAEGLMLPEGAMWLDGSLYVSAPPQIWKFTDADGDGRAERREVWFDGETLTGCANDLHGPHLGRDGWVYWCKGGFAEQEIPRHGRPALKTRASQIFRARPDGSRRESVMAGGMDNPVDVVSTRTGERIFTTTFLQHPANGRRDGLIHAFHGGLWGKDHVAVEAHPRTEPELSPVLTHLGPAAPSGLCSLESAHFGPPGDLCAAQFNLRRVSRHALKASGAGMTTEDSDLLVAESPDFHPTDVLEDADGSLIVIDTGGWYKLCCPTSQLVNPALTGGIYRVSRPVSAKVADPRGRKLDWSVGPAELAARLSDARPVVRQRATRVLAALGAKAIPALGESPSVEGVWVAAAIDAPEARALCRRGLGSPDSSVRQAALSAVSLWRDAEATGRVRALLPGTGAEARLAAECAGRVGDRAAIGTLVSLLENCPDRLLRHGRTNALLEINDAAATAEALGRHPAARASVWMALAQMDDGSRRPDAVPFLASANPAERSAALWLVGRDPGRAADVARFLRERLRDAPDAVSGLVDAFARTEAVSDVLAETLADGAVPLPARRGVARAMARSGVRQVPANWVRALTAALANADLAADAVTAARSLPLGRDGELAAALDRVADGGGPDALRLAALAAKPGGVGELGAARFDYVLARLDADRPLGDRGLAAEVLSRARLGVEQRNAVADALARTGPAEAERLVALLARTPDEALGRRAVAALLKSPARESLRVAAIRPALDAFPLSAREAAAPLYAAVTAAANERNARLDALLAGLKPGDARRGQVVFKGTKANCAACHAVGYVGGNVGPDLSKVGGVRTPRDLLEAILYPSASFVRSYEPVVATTHDERVFAGVVRRESDSEVVIAVDADREVRLDKADIAELVPGPVSLMPAGFDQQLTPAELADLVAFLMTCR